MRRSWRSRSRTGTCWSKIPDFYERLKDSYDEKFYQQEVLGAYLSMDGGRVYTAFDRETHVRELNGRIRTCRCCGRWISTWTR